MLTWFRRAWHRAVQNIANDGELQREADVFRLFLCVNYYKGAYDGAAEFEAHRIPPYQTQKAMVEESINDQVCSCVLT